MKRLSIAVVFITALIMFAATASAARPVERIPVDSQVLLCNGDWLHVTGTELVRSAVTTTPSGALLIAYHLNSQGISGIDPTTGTVYHSTGGTNETDLFPPSGGAVFTFLNRLHLQATAGAQSVVIRWVEHLTITPGGTVTANVSKFSASC